jgi:hypothetical protein
MAGVGLYGTVLSAAQIAAHAAATSSPAAYKTAALLDNPIGLWLLDELNLFPVPFKNPGVMTASSIEIQSTFPIATNFGSMILNEVIALPNPIAVSTLNAIGANTVINIPTGTTAITIVPPTANVNALTLKGVAGDTGIAISKTQPTEITIDPAQTTFVLNAAVATTVQLTFM